MERTIAVITEEENEKSQEILVEPEVQKSAVVSQPQQEPQKPKVIYDYLNLDTPKTNYTLAELNNEAPKKLHVTEVYFEKHLATKDVKVFLLTLFKHFQNYIFFLDYHRKLVKDQVDTFSQLRGFGKSKNHQVNHIDEVKADLMKSMEQLSFYYGRLLISNCDRIKPKHEKLFFAKLHDYCAFVLNTVFEDRYADIEKQLDAMFFSALFSGNDKELNSRKGHHKLGEGARTRSPLITLTYPTPQERLALMSTNKGSSIADFLPPVFREIHNSVLHRGLSLKKTSMGTLLPQENEEVSKLDVATLTLVE